jgi:hypothetical protein
VRKFGRSLSPTSVDSLTAPGSNTCCCSGWIHQAATGLWCWERQEINVCIELSLSSLASSKNIDLKTHGAACEPATIPSFRQFWRRSQTFGYFYPPCQSNLAKDLPTSLSPPLLNSGPRWTTGRTSDVVSILPLEQSRLYRGCMDYGGRRGCWDFQQVQKRWGVVDVDGQCAKGA